MTKEEDKQSRREFLHSVGDIGGTVAVYQAMISMGLMMPGEAEGAGLRNQWGPPIPRSIFGLYESKNF
jgi:hypothetical protein